MIFVNDSMARYLSEQHRSDLMRKAEQERMRHPKPITFFVRTAASRRASFRDPARKLGNDLG